MGENKTIKITIMKPQTRCTLKEKHLSKVDGRVLAQVGEQLTVIDSLHDSRLIVRSDSGITFNIHTVKLRRI